VLAPRVQGGIEAAGARRDGGADARRGESQVSAWRRSIRTETGTNTPTSTRCGSCSGPHRLRIVTPIPVPGINASVLTSCSAAAGGILGLFNGVLGRRAVRFSILGWGIMPYISAYDHHAAPARVIPSLEALKKEGEAGEDHAVHALRDRRPRVLPGVRSSAIALRGAGGLVLEPGPGFASSPRSPRHGTMFLMWLGEQITSAASARHLAPDLRRHRRGPASAIGLTLEQARTGAYSIRWCLASGRWSSRSPRSSCSSSARCARSGQLREAPGRQQGYQGRARTCR